MSCTLLQVRNLNFCSCTLLASAPKGPPTSVIGQKLQYRDIALFQKFTTPIQILCNILHFKFNYTVRRNMKTSLASPPSFQSGRGTHLSIERSCAHIVHHVEDGPEEASPGGASLGSKDKAKQHVTTCDSTESILVASCY